MRQSGFVYHLEPKFCPCGCGGSYRGLPDKPAQYVSRLHDRASSPDRQPVVPPRGRGRPRKNRAEYKPENGEGGTAELVTDDGAGEQLDLRELALG